jgi:carbohydrate kinase (thermoresistant glucokinase family)
VSAEAQDAVSASAIVVMGVSGAGKTTVGRALAERLHLPFIDADDLHPQANKDKMAGGTPLTDDDRWPWLGRVGEAVAAELRSGRGVVVACSALRRTYRDAIRRSADGPVTFAQLEGSADLLGERIGARSDHFMPPTLLTSQLQTLERLEPDETGSVFSVHDAPDLVASRIYDWVTTREDALA